MPCLCCTSACVASWTALTLLCALVVQAWVTREVVYSFEDKSNPASTILAARRGMCTNKATLQIALLRAVGIPAGYCVVHIHKSAWDSAGGCPSRRAPRWPLTQLTTPVLLAACFKPLVYDDIYRLISPVTVHVFCCAFIPEENRCGAR